MSNEYTEPYTKKLEYMFKAADTVKRQFQKIGRNEQCPCKSGKKFKNCCINKDIDWSLQSK